MRKICRQVLRPASVQYVQQFSDLINSLQCILLQFQEKKGTYARIINFDPVLSFAYHASYSSDILPNYWLFPFRDGNSNGPMTQTSLLSY